VRQEGRVCVKLQKQGDRRQEASRRVKVKKKAAAAENVKDKKQKSAAVVKYA